MHYKTTSAWIFVILALLVILMFLFPSKLTIWTGLIGLPVLVIYQAWIILRAEDSSPHEFTDDKWYEDR